MSTRLMNAEDLVLVAGKRHTSKRAKWFRREFTGSSRTTGHGHGRTFERDSAGHRERLGKRHGQPTAI